LLQFIELAYQYKGDLNVAYMRPVFINIEVTDKFGNLKMRIESTRAEKKPESQITEMLPENTLLPDSDRVEWYLMTTRMTMW
jgi:hypothetical protein